MPGGQAAPRDRLVAALKDPRHKVAPAQALLDRGFGKPAQAIEATGDNSLVLHLLAAQMVSEEMSPRLNDAGAANDPVRVYNNRCDTNGMNNASLRCAILIQTSDAFVNGRLISIPMWFLADISRISVYIVTYVQDGARMNDHDKSDAVLRLSLKVLAKDMRELRHLVEEQAEDEGLWFSPSTSGVGYLQHELLRLHGEVERVTRWAAD